jgi:hypothetical protein
MPLLPLRGWSVSGMYVIEVKNTIVKKLHVPGFAGATTDTLLQTQKTFIATFHSF